ncbi:hypothetical protein AciPR4_2903 [Terriglobus saanensis SP1PR4]|uniref:(2Fe-2S) ferredoxin domain-containing protein n=1 Tax=Terriglobus saanensis (strain ATCC BAA-1853 / DSM 23119 / SP1PR4) TaxID=401053 RepID=E8V4B6_TERSS|nr:hypothetical protein AciPR4_2903 [Terriglobus saanensis SP1PR4]
MSNNDQPCLRVFVCVTTRTRGRQCCASSGSAEIIPALRTELARRGRAAAHIDVRPCGCIHHCDEGPTLIGFTGEIAENPRPPMELSEQFLGRSDLNLTQVSLDQVRAIVDKLLGHNHDIHVRS